METIDLVVKYMKTKGYVVFPVHSADRRHRIRKGDKTVAEFTVRDTKITTKPAIATATKYGEEGLVVDIYEPDSLTRMAEFVHAICVLNGIYVVS